VKESELNLRLQDVPAWRLPNRLPLACRSSTALDAKVSAFLYTWGAGRNSLEGEHIPVRVEPMELPPIQSMLLIPTVMEHPIDERSPLFNLNYDNLVAMQAEVVVTFEAVSDFGDSFMVRQSYLATEVHWGHIFTPITHKAPPGDVRHVVNLSLFHDVMPQPELPQLPPGPLSRHVLAKGPPGNVQALPYPALGENTLVISDCCTMTVRDKQKFLMFRVGDTRPGQMIETHVRGYLYEWCETRTKEGERLPYSVQVRACDQVACSTHGSRGCLHACCTYQSKAAPTIAALCNAHLPILASGVCRTVRGACASLWRFHVLYVLLRCEARRSAAVAGDQSGV
jgi:Inward rectifier potassium channel C-terminal domain